MGIIFDTAKRLADEGNTVDVILACVKAMEDGSIPPRKGKDGSPRAELQTVLDPVHSEAVLEYRQRIKAPLTGYAAKLLAAEFKKCEYPNAAADLMISKGWRSFKADWMANEGTRSSSPISNLRGVAALENDLRRRVDERFELGRSHARAPDPSAVRLLPQFSFDGDSRNS